MSKEQQRDDERERDDVTTNARDRGDQHLLMRLEERAEKLGERLDDHEQSEDQHERQHLGGVAESERCPQQ